jgi:integrative and conjugative element protein (TIGR02256 family)
LKFFCSAIGLTLSISETFVSKLILEGRKHYPKEYGGILVGRYSDDLKACIVEDTILPQNHKSSRYAFERGKEGLAKKLSDLYEQTPRLIYIGEWHTHPDSVPVPSTTDKQAMLQIANDNGVTIASPVLLILGLNRTAYTLGAYLQFQNQLIRYEQQD